MENNPLPEEERTCCATKLEIRYNIPEFFVNISDAFKNWVQSLYMTKKLSHQQSTFRGRSEPLTWHGLMIMALPEPGCTTGGRTCGRLGPAVAVDMGYKACTSQD